MAAQPSDDTEDHTSLFSQSIINLKQSKNESDDSEPQSMNGDFFKLLAQFDKIISNYMTDEKHILPCINNFIVLCKTVDRADLFSNNEEFDEIQTDYLKFVLLHSMLSQLYSNRNPPNRVKWLNISNEYASLFLNRCDQWGILSKMDQYTFYSFKSKSLNDKKNSKNNNNSNDLSDDEKSDPNYNRSNKKTKGSSGFELAQSLNAQFAQRNALIMRHKLDEAAKEKIELLLQNNKLKHAKPPNNENKWKLFRDEESEREYWQLKLQIAIRHALRTIKFSK